ncbi:helix-turn-helix transcriptional regulator [Oceaniglobus trochenteri]|uniref:helix-turn-helix transcriptional regulator n=1 Tax=Oceaniglobus trochenteri TaxID=2763260 RepID=UPI001CFFB5B9|nr:YafY family protein [Oceaniglobus trochenteri]
MARSDRLLRLLQALRSLPAPVTAARLAAETDVSERTLYRDIDALRAAGAVIDGAAGQGYWLTEDPALPPQSFSRIEIEALVLAMGELAARGDPAIVAAGEAALAKIIATLPETKQRQAMHAVVTVNRWGRPPPTTLDLSLYRQACWDETALDIAYCDASGAATRRRIYPLTIVYSERIVSLLAWCLLRADFRQFHMHRIESVTLSDEGFRPRRVALLRDYLARLRGTDRKARP